jgi:acetyltransferase EpsM
MNKVTIIGAGGHAKVVAEAIRLQGLFEVEQFIDDAANSPRELLGYRVLSGFYTLENCLFVVAIGDNKIRKEKFQSLLRRGGQPVTVVHPAALVSPSATIGNGTFIAATAVVGPCAVIGDNVIINTSAVVEHDNVIESHSHVAVGAKLTGACTVREGAFIGAGAVLVPKIEAGQWCVIGAGSVVLRNVDPSVTAVGVPARIV